MYCVWKCRYLAWLPDLRIDQVYVVSKYMEVTTYKYMWLSIWEWVSKSVFDAKGKLTSLLQLPLLSAE